MGKREEALDLLEDYLVAEEKVTDYAHDIGKTGLHIEEAQEQTYLLLLEEATVIHERIVELGYVVAYRKLKHIRRGKNGNNKRGSDSSRYIPRG